jgi:hypothetical protein
VGGWVINVNHIRGISDIVLNKAESSGAAVDRERRRGGKTTDHLREYL